MSYEGWTSEQIAAKRKSAREHAKRKWDSDPAYRMMVTNRQRARRQNNPIYRAKQNAWHLVGKYGITWEQKQEMFKQQDECCANTGCRAALPSPAKAHVDHDHVTGKVRALLCGGCNTALGQAKEDPARLRGLASYVEDKALDRII